MFLVKAFNSSVRTYTSRVNAFPHVRQLHKSIKVNAGESVPTGSAGHRPDIWDKRMLVFMKRYPSVAAVPTFVPAGTMDKVRNQVRIRVNLAMCIITAFVSLAMYQYNKHHKGETLYERREREMKEQEQQQPTSA